MKEMRRAPRYPTFAKARIDGFAEGEALLKDLSVTGCRLEFSAAIAFSLADLCRIRIMPEDRSSVEAFEIEANPLWSRAGYDSFEVGFSIGASPKGRFFERYVDYLAWKAARGE
jgi:hypothetical protein